MKKGKAVGEGREDGGRTPGGYLSTMSSSLTPIEICTCESREGELEATRVGDELSGGEED